MSPYRKESYKTKFIYFLMKDDELLERYNDIWKKIEHIIKTQFDSVPV